MMDSATFRVVREYENAGVPLDDLAYTATMCDILRRSGIQPTQDNLHHYHTTLRQMRKDGKLPRPRYDP